MQTARSSERAVVLLREMQVVMQDRHVSSLGAKLHRGRLFAAAGIALRDAQILAEADRALDLLEADRLVRLLAHGIVEKGIGGERGVAALQRPGFGGGNQ